MKHTPRPQPTGRKPVQVDLDEDLHRKLSALLAQMNDGKMVQATTGAIRLLTHLNPLVVAWLVGLPPDDPVLIALSEKINKLLRDAAINALKCSDD